MASSTSSVVLSRYAGAIIELAEQAKAVEKIQKDFKDIAAMVASSNDLAQVISSPLISRKKQEAIISDIAAKAKFHKLTCNFLGLLVENRRLNALPEIIKAYDRAVLQRSGEVSVRIETASELTAAQEKDFNKKISAAIGSNVSIETSITPEIIGGSIVTIGSYMIDDSVRRKLERLGAALKQTSNSNVAQNLKEVV